MTLDKIREDARDAIAAAVVPLSKTIDGYLLLCGLLGHASIIAEMAIAAKLLSPGHVKELFEGTLKMVLEPKKPIPTPVVIYVDEDGDRGRMH